MRKKNKFAQSASKGEIKTRRTKKEKSEKCKKKIQ